MSYPQPSIAIIGAGPRGASLLERIAAHLTAIPASSPGTKPTDAVSGDPVQPLTEPPGAEKLTIHVVDDKPSGAGAVWAADQTRELCMNTLSDAVTLFTEPTSTVIGPVLEGPTLYEWCLLALWDLERSETLQSSANPTHTGHTINPPYPTDTVIPANVPGSHRTDAEPLNLDTPDAVGKSFAGAGTAATTTSPTVPLYERITNIPREKRRTYQEFPARQGFARDFREELAATVPESHPSRALYGEYLGWCYDRAVASLPEHVTVVRHFARAVNIASVEHTDENEQTERITLDSGDEILAHSVVLATGWLPRRDTPSETELASVLRDRSDLIWVRPASPVDQSLNSVPKGADIIVRGLGMGFFDTMALLTIERGGTFEVDPLTTSGLRYVASGAEPRIHVTSGRGVPFRAKSLYRSLPPRAEQRYVRGVDWTVVPGPIDFNQHLWPRIVADAMFDYAATLSRVQPEALTDFSAFKGTLDTTLHEILAWRSPMSPLEVIYEYEHALAPFFVNPADRFRLAQEIRPADHTFSSPEEYQHWVADRIASDLFEGGRGRDSALKAGLWSISSARGFASRLGSFGRFDAESRATGFAELFHLGGMVGSGPPAFRNQQLLALMDAGLVHFIGPDAKVTVTPEGFAAASDAVPGSRVVGSALIDAWMHQTNVSETSDPLTRGLIESGRARPFSVPSRYRESGSAYITRSFDIDAATGLLINVDGNLDTSIHAAGIPVDETVHDTIISPMPGTDPTMLRETDRVSLSALTIARALSRLAQPAFTS